MGLGLDLGLGLRLRLWLRFRVRLRTQAACSRPACRACQARTAGSSASRHRAWMVERGEIAGFDGKRSWFLEAARSSSWGSGGAPSGLASSWECRLPRAAGRALRRRRTRTGALPTRHFDHTVLPLARLALNAHEPRRRRGQRRQWWRDAGRWVARERR